MRATSGGRQRARRRSSPSTASARRTGGAGRAAAPFRWHGSTGRRRADRSLDVPSGKIHHWAGAIFVPGVSVDEVLKRLAELAGNEQKHYADVLASRLIARHDDRYQIFMKLRRSKVITVTYNTEHDVRYRRLGAARAQRPQRRHAHRAAGRCRHAAGARTEARLRQRVSVAAECLLALRSGARRRADRMRVGEPQPRRSLRAAAVCHRHGRRARARVARTHADRTAQLPDWQVAISCQLSARPPDLLRCL